MCISWSEALHFLLKGGRVAVDSSIVDIEVKYSFKHSAFSSSECRNVSVLFLYVLVKE